MALASISEQPDDTEDLLGEAARGNADAVRRLLDRHRARLCRMVSLRLDSRLWARVDPSDIVQEALADAAQKLSDYTRDRPIPFYPWLHRLTGERLTQAYRRHRQAGARSVERENGGAFTWPDHSAGLLIDRLVATDTTPGAALEREERRKRLYTALEQLSEADREVLVLRYLEDLTFPEIAGILGHGEGAVKMRHLRALQRIRLLLEEDGSGSNA